MTVLPSAQQTAAILKQKHHLALGNQSAVFFALG